MTEEQTNVINKTIQYVQDTLSKDSSGHDWWHINRVYKLACQIAQLEGADEYTVALAALLHDIADWKFHGGDDSVGPRVAEQWLNGLSVDIGITEQVCRIIKEVSFKGAGVEDTVSSLEAKVVQDADRLDALGAIGIGRTFAYGGHKGRKMYDPEIKPTNHQTFDEYKNSVGTTVNHFYEKLFLLKDRMNTKTGQQLAEYRHQVMEEFISQFMSEWNAELGIVPQ